MGTDRGNTQLTGRTLLAAAILALAASCADDGALEQLARATEAEEYGRYREAIIELRNAVAVDPRNPEVRYQLGAAALTLGDAATAEKELARARELGFDLQASIAKMAEAFLLLGRPDEALVELAQAQPQGAEVLALIAAAYEAQGEADRSIDAYQRALALDPEEERALLGIARAAVGKVDFASAQRAYDAAVAAHGDSPTVRLDYGRFLHELGRAEEAEAQFALALAQPLLEEHRPLRWELSLALAEAQLAQGKLGPAEETIDDLNDLQADHVLVKYLRARTAFERRDLTVANDLVGRVLVEVPGFVAGEILQATIYLVRGEYTLAEELLERMAVIRPNDPQVRTLLTAARRGGEAAPAGAGAATTLSQREVMSLLGAANAQTGDYTAAVDLWERVLEENPEDEHTRLELLTGYLFTQDVDAASALLEGAEWDDPANAERAAVLDAMLSLQKRDVDAARGKASLAAQQFPASASVRSMQGLVEMRDNPTAAARYFDQALDLDPSYSTAAVNLANLAAAAGEEVAATKRLAAFVEAYPDDAMALDALARLQLRADDLAGARASLERARRAAPEALAPRAKLVDLLARVGEYRVAEEVAREMIAAQPTAVSAHNALGVALIGLGKLEEGVKSLRTGLRIDGTARDPLRNLARAEYASGNLVQASRTIDQLLRAHPEDTVGLDLATRVAVDRGRADEADGYLERLIAADGVSALSQVLTGDVAMVRGQHEKAVQAYEAVFAQQQSTALVMRLYRARQRNGHALPQQVLRDWLDAFPEDQTVLMAAAAHAHAAGDLVTAATDYERLLRLNRENVVAWNNLAWAYSDLGDFRALEASRRAFDLAKGSPTIQDTYGWMLVLDDQLDNGISILRDAWEAAETGEIGYHLAAGLARAGARDEARTVLRRALADGGQFEARGEAEALMETL
ncbi:MAG: XrtA/PEP-CTERM system TPR-repeat protein PrsT [Pseudomonadota bacterium]